MSLGIASGRWPGEAGDHALDHEHHEPGGEAVAGDVADG